MTGKLLRLLLILGVTLLCGQGQLSAQSASAYGSPAKRALRGIGHFPVVPETSHAAALQTTGPHLHFLHA